MTSTGRARAAPRAGFAGRASLAPLVASIGEALSCAPEGVWPGQRRVFAGLSGGPDSIALLLALCEVRLRGGLDWLGAIHVNHGIERQALQWQALCERHCESLGVDLAVRAVDARARAGEGPEAAARAARYGAYASCLAAGDVLCTGHHGGDQAETVLLALLRGAGPRGVAAMPRWKRFAAGYLCRPLLGLGRETLARAVADAGLDAADDPSNRHPGLARGHLRERVMPVLEQFWPGVSTALSRAASHQAEAAGMLDTLGRMDCGYELVGVGAGSVPARLAVERLSILEDARARNALRVWVGDLALPLPPARVLKALLDECAGARPGAAPQVRWADVCIRRHRGWLYALRPAPTVPEKASGRHLPANTGAVCNWPGMARGEALRIGRSLLTARPVARAARGTAIDIARAQSGIAEVRFRRGGERCRPAGRAHSQTLKKLLQAYGVPPWERGGLPLVYIDGQLAAVPGLWVCAEFEAPEREAGLLVELESSPDA